MRDELITVVEGYLDGLKKKDLSRVAFAPDVTFERPLSPKLTGERAVVDFLSGLFPAIKDIRVKQHIVEGEYVATLFDFDTTFGVIPVWRTESLSKYDHSMIPVRPRIHRNRNGGRVTIAPPQVAVSEQPSCISQQPLQRTRLSAAVFERCSAG